MPFVSHTVEYPDGSFAAGRVTIDLVGENGRPVTDVAYVGDDDHGIMGSWSAELDAGRWAVDLTANADIIPSGTRWRVQSSVDGTRGTYYLNVPATLGPHLITVDGEDEFAWFIGDPGLLDEAPASVESSALAAHRVSFHNTLPVSLGADGTANSATINAALVQARAAGGGLVQLPAGEFDVADDLEIDGLAGVAVGIIGTGVGSSHLNYTGSGRGIKQATPGTRIYNVTLRDFSVTNTGTGTIGIDLDSVSTGFFQRVNVNGFDTGWRLGSVVNGGCVFNRFVACLATNAETGWDIAATGSNENVWVACRANACSVRGFSIVDSNHNVLDACAIESCGVGLHVEASSNGLADSNTAHACRFEGNTTGVHVTSSNVRSATLIANHLTGNGTDVTDVGTRTLRITMASGIILNGVPYYVERAAAADDAIRVQVTGDTEYRLVVDADGTMRRGSGSATQDASWGYSSSGPTHVFVGNMSVGTAAGVTSAKFVTKPTATTQRSLLVQGIASQSVDRLLVEDSTGADEFKVTKNGHTVVAKTSAPADADLAAGEMAIWFDSTNGAAKLMIKAKQADGTVRTGQVALA